MDFTLDLRLKADSELIAHLDLCQLRLKNDRRWPWLILIPQHVGLTEIFDLAPLDLTKLIVETNLVAQGLAEATAAKKINIGALGNVVKQFHMHVVARFEGDANWPNPVWGYGKPVAWDVHGKSAFIKKILDFIA